MSDPVEPTSSIDPYSVLEELTAPITIANISPDFTLGTAQGFVRAFMQFGDQEVATVPRASIPQEQKDRIKSVLREEMEQELFVAIDTNNLPEVADALADSIYVLLSIATAYGIYMPAVLREVCYNNHLKTLSPKRVNELGKVLKPEGHPAPRILQILDILSGRG